MRKAGVLMSLTKLVWTVGRVGRNSPLSIASSGLSDWVVTFHGHENRDVHIAPTLLSGFVDIHEELGRWEVRGDTNQPNPLYCQQHSSRLGCGISRELESGYAQCPNSGMRFWIYSRTGWGVRSNPNPAKPPELCRLSLASPKLVCICLWQLSMSEIGEKLVEKRSILSQEVMRKIAARFHLFLNPVASQLKNCYIYFPD